MKSEILALSKYLIWDFYFCELCNFSFWT